MRLNFQLLLLFSVIAITTQAQQDQFPSLTIGDPAPPLRLRQWIKGIPVQRFEAGHVYVVEFWATWCGYCIDAMPHLSTLAAAYKDQVTILGVDILEKKTTSINKVKAFVDSMGSRMDYSVAAEDSNFMAAHWLYASGEQGIPATYVVNGEGKVAWIGHPLELDTVLLKMVNNTWDIKEAMTWRKETLTKRKEYERLAQLDYAASQQLNQYAGDPTNPLDLGKPDSALLAIEQIVQNNPQLKYTPLVASHTFSALLKTDPHKAYDYGREVLMAPTYMDPAFGAIVDAIEWYGEKTNIVSLPAEIYELGAEAYQTSINRSPMLHRNFAKTYLKMADWYLRAKNREKAIQAMQKAIDTMKSEK